MDIGRFLQVAWRFKLALAAGLTLATLVAMFSFVRLDTSGGMPSLAFRENDSWLSASTLLVTQDGFPWGRAILDETVPLAGSEDESGEAATVPRFSDPGRYSGLAALYAELAKADEVQARVMKNAKPGEHYESMVVQQPGASATLPMIYLKGYGPTPEAAVDVAQRASVAFIDYLEQEQAESRISQDKRIEVVVTAKYTPPQLFEKRSFVRPIMLFLLISMVTLAIIFALENLRPRREPENEYVDMGDLWSAPEPQPVGSHHSE
jgi:hypothetical protein